MTGKRKRITTQRAAYSGLKRGRFMLSRSLVPSGRYARDELKFFDTTLGSTTVATTGNILQLSLNLIPQGVTESTRVGRKCTIKHLKLRGQILLPEATASASCGDRLRLIYFVDRQANGATAAVLDILETAAINAHRNLAEQGRFLILSDRTVDYNQQAGGGDGTTEDYARLFRTMSFTKVLNVPIEFNSTAGAITEVRSNNIGLLGISAAGDIGVSYTARVRFSDGS